MGGDATQSSNVNPSLQSPVSTLAHSADPAKPAVILLAGLQGAGKTTAAAKLALYLKEREVDPAALEGMSEEIKSQTLNSRLPKRNRKVLLVAADVYRPAAIEQLQILGGQVGVEVFSMGADADPAGYVAAAHPDSCASCSRCAHGYPLVNGAEAEHMDTFTHHPRVASPIALRPTAGRLPSRPARATH